MATTTYDYAVIANGVYYPAFTPVPIEEQEKAVSEPADNVEKKAAGKNGNKRTGTKSKAKK